MGENLEFLLDPKTWPYRSAVWPKNVATQSIETRIFEIIISLYSNFLKVLEDIGQEWEKPYIGSNQGGDDA